MGAVDFEARVLIDLWDHDTLNARDFMGYVEVSLEDLIASAESGSPLQVQGPQGKDDAGRIYVEKSVIGFPQVKPTSLTGLRVGEREWWIYGVRRRLYD